MNYFARPNLDDNTFRQISGSTLTLEGVNKISELSGLTLTDGNGDYRPIIAAGGNVGDVLTLAPDGKTICLSQPVVDGIGVYSGASPTTITVGGLDEGTEIFGSGITTILERILVPTVNPTIVGESIDFDVTPTTSLYEVGYEVNLTGLTTFDRGCAFPHYDDEGECVGSSTPFTGLPFEYEYYGIDSASILSTDLTNTRCITHCILPGSQCWGSRVCYSQGDEIYDSSGSVFDQASQGSIQTSKNFNGVFPYFWGVVTEPGAAGSNRPSATAGLVTGGTKEVLGSVGTITINFGSSSDDYLWFAIPEDSPNRNEWFISALNNGDIGGSVSPGGNLFPDPVIVSVPSNVWDIVGESPKNYKVYISNYQSAATQNMQLRT